MKTLVGGESMTSMNPTSRHRCLAAVFVFVAGLLFFAGPLAAQAPGESSPEEKLSD
jgi:hypothetical protein